MKSQRMFMLTIATIMQPFWSRRERTRKEQVLRRICIGRTRRRRL